MSEKLRLISLSRLIVQNLKNHFFTLVCDEPFQTRSKMMESARIRPEYLVGPLEYDTEFYSSPPDVKWNPESGVRLHDSAMTINVDTGDDFLIDELINFDDAGTHKMPSPVYR